MGAWMYFSPQEDVYLCSGAPDTHESYSGTGPGLWISPKTHIPRYRNLTNPLSIIIVSGVDSLMKN